MQISGLLWSCLEIGHITYCAAEVESSKAGIIGHILPGSGLKYYGLMKHVQKFWGNYPLEKRMDPVLQMDVVRSDANAVNGVNGVHVKG